MSRGTDSSPYKFLDPYEQGDQDLFFGRDRETRTLVADVVVSRLVVLFAKTGTGKTSLINAGVRPDLEELGYRTFFVRVQEDPTKSLRTVLTEELEIERLPARPLAGLLTWVANKVEQPIVVFFDQFEEFFVYLAERQSAEARKFISQIAKTRQNRDVHVVFSMREEFFVDMDIFRDAIPTIFHNDSNLRLRWFDPAQARDAIVRPAKSEGVEIELNLADRLVEDLAEEGLVEPAQLQIVCHTLWKRTGGKPTLSRYRDLGGGDGVPNVARRILDERLEEEFSKLKTEEELELLEELLPLLRTRRGTKYLTDLDRLVAELGKPEPLLRSVLEQLESSGLVRTHGREMEQVELTHDYLVERLDELRARVSVIWPRRVLSEALERYRETETFGTSTEDLERVLERACDESEERERKRKRAKRGRSRQRTLVSASDLRLEPDEAEFLFRFALHRGLHMSRMFAAANEQEVPVWHVLEATIEHGGIVDASYGLDLLAELGTSGALAILERAWTREDIAPRAVEVLGRIQSGGSIELLERALRKSRLARAAQDALTGLAQSRDERIARRAANVLVEYLGDALGEADRASAAVEDLGRIEEKGAVQMLSRVLDDDALRHDAYDALLRLTRSAKADVASRATDVLLERAQEAFAHRALTPAELQYVARVHDVRAVQLLERALSDADLVAQAEQALTRLQTSLAPGVADEATRVLAARVVAPVRPVPFVEPERRPARRLATEPVTAKTGGAPPELLDSHYGVAARAILEGRVVPFLGAGVNASGRPAHSRWKPGASFLPFGFELAEYLGQRFEYPPDEAPDVLRVAQWIALMAGRAWLYEELHKVFSAAYATTPAHRFLASLPELLRARNEPNPLIVTTNFDDLLEQAFSERFEEIDVVTYIAEGDDRGKFMHRTPGGPLRIINAGLDDVSLSLDARPVILKLHGSVDRDDSGRDSFAITEDNYVDYLVSGDVAALLPIELVVRLRRSHFLFLGHSLRDWNLRVAVRRLWEDREFDYRSWAIQLAPSTLDRRAWERRRVEVLDIHVDDYLEGLQGRLEELPPEAALT